MVYLDAATRRPQLVDAAMRAFARDGVAATSLRAVAAEAGVPLGTLQHVFPTKELLLRAVVETVIEQIAQVLEASADAPGGLEHAIRTSVTRFWANLVEDDIGLQLMQYELTLYALRTPGQGDLARTQYERYADVVAQWCERAAENAGETSEVPFRQLARMIVGGIDGLIIQYACNPDAERARGDVDLLIRAVIAVAGVRAATADGVLAGGGR